MGGVVVNVKDLSKNYIENGVKSEILKSISFKIEIGQSLAIVGPSGCGKTSLLQILGLIDKDFEGDYEFLEEKVFDFNEKKRNETLKKKISFVHQFHHLFPEFSAIENVAIAAIISGFDKNEAKKSALELLENLGLEGKKDVNPWQLSGGERQRVAMARAMINRPKLLLADEPTGNLDPKNSEIAMENLINLCKTNNTSLIFVTHNHNLAKECDEILQL